MTPVKGKVKNLEIHFKPEQHGLTVFPKAGQAS